MPWRHPENPGFPPPGRTRGADARPPRGSDARPGRRRHGHLRRARNQRNTGPDGNMAWAIAPRICAKTPAVGRFGNSNTNVADFGEAPSTQDRQRLFARAPCPRPSRTPSGHTGTRVPETGTRNCRTVDRSATMRRTSAPRGSRARRGSPRVEARFFADVAGTRRNAGSPRRFALFRTDTYFWCCPPK